MSPLHAHCERKLLARRREEREEEKKATGNSRDKWDPLELNWPIAACHRFAGVYPLLTDCGQCIDVVAVFPRAHWTLTGRERRRRRRPAAAVESKSGDFKVQTPLDLVI